MHDSVRYLLQVVGRRTRVAFALGLLGLVATVFGCGSESNMAPVEGVVRLDGQPLSTGTIRFTPEAGRAASGKIQSDGTFELSTFSEGDGALVGKHGVAITAYEGGSSTPNFEVDRPQMRSLIPEYYGSPVSSQLTFEVKSGETNHAEFDLSSK